MKVWEAAFLLKSSSETLGLDLDLPQDQSPWALTLTPLKVRAHGFPGNLFLIYFIN